LKWILYLFALVLKATFDCSHRGVNLFLFFSFLGMDSALLIMLYIINIPDALIPPAMSCLIYLIDQNASLIICLRAYQAFERNRTCRKQRNR
jgi:hypothetical protein